MSLSGSIKQLAQDSVRDQEGLHTQQEQGQLFYGFALFHWAMRYFLGTSYSLVGLGQD